MNVADTVKALDKAFNSRDLDAVLSFYGDDALMVIEPPDRVARGKDEIRRAFEILFKGDYEAHQEKMNVLENDDTALYLSEWSLLNKVDCSRDTYNAISVFQREGDNWKLVIDNAFGQMILGI